MLTVVGNQTGHIVRPGYHFIFSLILLMGAPLPCLFICVCIDMGVRGQFVEVLSFYYMGLKDQTQVGVLSSKLLYLMSHFASPCFFIFIVIIFQAQVLQPRLTSNLKSFCFSLWSTEVKGSWHYTRQLGVSVKMPWMLLSAVGDLLPTNGTLCISH